MNKAGQVISGNTEIVTFFTLCMLIYLVVTGRVEGVLRSITGAKDTASTTSSSDTSGTNPPPSFGPPSRRR